MSKHDEVLFIEQLCKQSRSARAVFPLTKSKSSSPILDIFKVFLAYKYVEKLMEMTFMFKNTKGSYTWYPSNMEVMPLPRHERVDVSVPARRENTSAKCQWNSWKWRLCSKIQEDLTRDIRLTRRLCGFLVIKELMSVPARGKNISATCQVFWETHGNDVYVQKYKRILHVISV